MRLAGPQRPVHLRWQGKVEDSTETMLLIKTCVEQLAALEARLHALHSLRNARVPGARSPTQAVRDISTGSWQV